MNNKKFLIIGNANAITNKDIFPHIAGGEVFIRTKDGVTNFAMHFKTPDGEKTASALWYTNLDSRHLYQTLELTKKYDPEKYPKYDNYNAIEVDRIKDIPYDYDGVMGVPISIVLFSPIQFEIVGEANNGKDSEWDLFTPSVDGKTIFKRILIKQVQDKKKVDFEVIGITENADYLKPLYIDGNEKYDRPYINGRRMYSRILIKKNNRINKNEECLKK